MEVEVPDANYVRVLESGYLELRCGTDGYSEMAGLFKNWNHVVIKQRWLRGPGGRFVSKENR